MSALTITYVGGPTALLEVAGLRLLTDPTFDPAGRKYNFGWGTSSRKLQDPALTAGRARPDRRGPAQPRPARRQPRRRRPRDAALGRQRDHDPRRQPQAGRQLARPRPLGLDHPAGARRHRGPDHRHPLPPRPAAEPADRRRGDRLPARVGGTARRRGLDHRRHRLVLRHPRGGGALRRRHRDRPPRRRPLPGHRPRPLHDERRRGRPRRRGSSS